MSDEASEPRNRRRLFQAFRRPGGEGESSVDDDDGEVGPPSVDEVEGMVAFEPEPAPPAVPGEADSHSAAPAPPASPAPAPPVAASPPLAPSPPAAPPARVDTRPAFSPVPAVAEPPTPPKPEAVPTAASPEPSTPAAAEPL